MLTGRAETSDVIPCETVCRFVYRLCSRRRCGSAKTFTRVFILQQALGHILKLQKGHELLFRFDLNPNEVKACRDLEVQPGLFSELFIKFFNQAVVAKIEPSALDYWIATTDPEDFLEESNLRLNSPGLTHLEILQRLAAQYPHGVKKISHEVLRRAE